MKRNTDNLYSSGTEGRPRKKYIVGIDEAGRGALAGPVAVGAVMVPYDFSWEVIPGVGDSKMVAPKKREAIYELASELASEGALFFHVALVSARIIDTHGITYAVARGIDECFEVLAPNHETTHVKLDGLLRAPERFTSQETIVKGDATELEIGLASILAKVTRDRYMVALAPKYPHYGFEIHKGYGTDKHRRVIGTRGLLDIHRTTFCRSCQVPE